MTVRMMLVTPALSASLREARFDEDGALDAAGVRDARAAAGALPAATHRWCGTSPRCRETATELGVRADPQPALAGWDMGRWSGRTLSEVSAEEPEAVGRWLADPAAAPHGGESLLELCARVGGWCAALPDDAGKVLAVVEPAVVRAVVVHALALPTETFWRLDVAPLTLTELSGRAGRWNLSAGRPLTPHTPPRTPRTPH